MIKNDGEVGHSWQNQDLMKLNYRKLCKDALVDFYRLQTLVEDGLGDAVINDLL